MMKKRVGKLRLKGEDTYNNGMKNKIIYMMTSKIIFLYPRRVDFVREKIQDYPTL